MIKDHAEREASIEFISSRQSNRITYRCIHVWFGPILLQRGSEDQSLHPVYYASGEITTAEEKYPSYEF